AIWLSSAARQGPVGGSHAVKAEAEFASPTSGGGAVAPAKCSAPSATSAASTSAYAARARRRNQASAASTNMTLAKSHHSGGRQAKRASTMPAPNATAAHSSGAGGSGCVRRSKGNVIEQIEMKKQKQSSAALHFYVC